MNYKETIDYLYEKLPMFSRIGEKAYKKDLTNIISLCEQLNQPHTSFKTIHVAGTNGKGSTSHMLAAILQEAGYKTGLYTSPHIYDFRERIRINGNMISENAVVDFVKKMSPLTIEPSFFEMNVAMAFNYFAEEKVDIAIIETGLGGRLDSTNIIHPELSVITNIGLDHMDLLGNSLEQIAYEKAGIIKKDTPVVIGETHFETLAEFKDKSKEMNAPMHLAEQELLLESGKIEGHSLFCTFEYVTTNKKINLRLNSTAFYQLKNVRTVLCAVELLKRKHFKINDDAIISGIANVKELTGFKGRWEIISKEPAVIIDVAHNEDGISRVLDQLSTQYRNSNIHFIIGFVKDKEIDNILNLFPKKANYYFTNAKIPRALNHNELREKANTIGLAGNSYNDINEALEEAKNKANKNDVIMICGSFFILENLAQ
jgi:dihydrofolate synthase/folylpolyglutamate synthase